MEQLTAGELAAGEQRVISGSVLDGRAAMGEAEAYLGRYHQQVSALPEGRGRELLGWIAPGPDKFSVAGVVLGAFARSRPRGLHHDHQRLESRHGAHRHPRGGDAAGHPAPPSCCARCCRGDVERAEALGALELDEEDLALCTYADPGKNDYAPLLRDMLHRLEKEA